MAAEDDYGNTFGDFIASFPPNPPPTISFHSNHLPQSNGINSSTDDVEWGDFVEYPQLLSSTQSEPSKSRSEDSKMVSPTRWVKPSGALPLSLFGDADEEEHKDGVDPNSNFGSNHTRNGSDYKSVGNTNTFGVNDIIANLYNQTQQIKIENGSGMNSSPRVDYNVNGLILDDKSAKVSIENGLKLNAVSSGFSELNLDFNGINLNSNVNCTKSFSDQSLENGSGSCLSTRVDVNANDLVLEGQTGEVKVENGVHSSSNMYPVRSDFSEWNIDFSGMNLNVNVNGTKSLSSGQSVENGPGTNTSTRVDSNVNDWVLDGKSRELKVENGFSSSSNLNAASSVFSEWNMDFNGINLNSNVDGTKSLSDHSQQIKSRNSGLSIKSNGPDPYQDGSSSHLFGGWTLELNKYSSSAKTLNSNLNTLGSNLDNNGREKELDGATCDHNNDDDDEDDGWEFKGAYSEWWPGDVNNAVGKTVDSEVNDFSEESADSSGIGNGLIHLFGTPNQSIDLFSTSTEVDLFSTSSFPSSSQEVKLFEVQPSIAAPISFSSDTNSNIEQTDIKDGLNPSSNVGYVESDDGFGEFTTAFSESEPKSREALDDDIHSPSKEAVSMLDGKVQGNETKLYNHEGALPLSIFGEEEPETNGHVDVRDAFMHQPTSYQRNGHASNSVISIHELLSNLYGQVEQASSVDTMQKPIEIKLSCPSDAVSNSDTVHNDDGDFDDNTWEFTDAFSQKRNNDEASHFSIEDEHVTSSSKLVLNNFVDFYSRLRDELCFIAKVHIESLENARSTAALSGESAEVAALDNEFLEASKELDQMNVIFKEDDSLDNQSGEGYIKEFIEVLSEPKFLVLESEYQLSEKLLLVKRDLRLAIELIKHSTTMMKILKLGTLEEQQMYVTTWSEMISFCSQELKHGSLVWKQAIDKKIQSQLLSEPQGREFILAIGEIYKVVVIIGASAKIFKPWTISCWSNIDILLEECHTLWSTSGFEEALLSVSETSSSDDASLLKSIKYVCGLDAFALQNCVFRQHESLCRLSILSAGAVPGMKMIMWEDEQYFVTLANLWANLISHNPPELPHLHIG